MRPMRAFLIALAISSLPALIFSAPASAGKVGSANVDVQLDLRFLSPLPADNNPELPIQAAVLKAGKLSAFGFAAIKEGDKVTLTLSQRDGRFSISYAGKSISFEIDPQGDVRAVHK
jgi:hypothetical protein